MYNCGVFERNIVNTPIRPGVFGEPADQRASVYFCSEGSPSEPRSSTISLKPLAVPMPGTGGAPKTLTMASLISRLYVSRRRYMIASAFSSAARRLSKGSSTTNIEPKFELLAVSRIDWPDTATVALNAGRLRGRASRLSASLPACVPTADESGSCTLTSSQP